MAEKMNRQIEGFQEKYIQVENRLMASADESRSYIEEIINDFEDVKISKISSRIAALDDEIAELRKQRAESLDLETDQIKDDLKKYSSELAVKLEQELNNAKENLRSAHREEEKNLQSARDELEQIRETLDMIAGDIKTSIRSETDHSITLIKEARKAEEEHFVRVRDDMNRTREELKDRLETLEGQLREAGKFRAKVDEYIKEAAQSVENAGNQVIGRLEQQTKANAVKYMEALQSQLNQARGEFQKLRTEIGQEAAQARELRDRLSADMSEDRARLEKFMEKLSVIDKAEELTEQLDSTVETLSEKLKEAKTENARMHEFMRGIETIRETRKELESELRLLDAQRERITQAEDHFHDIDRQLTGLGEKFALLARGEEIAEELENRTEQLVQFREEFEKFYDSMNEKRKFMESALRSIEKSKEETRNAVDAATKLISKVERAEHRQEDVAKYLQSLENKAAALRKMESDIQQVEARFEQMEGLFEDLNSRQGQISVMTKKVEDIKSSGEHIKSELESVIHEADEKMDRLSAFYQTVDRMLSQNGTPSEPAAISSISEKSRTSSSAEKKPKTAAGAGSIPDWKKEGIISLHLKHKWDADLIAEKIKLEPSVVKAVIASYMAASR